ncbi:MAG: hypothetical protein ABJA98_31520 [Acidobacteriota bacterium]|jgi:hypothetical protein
MRAFAFILALSFATLLGGSQAAAQEGHPLKGSWLGTWAGNKIHGNDVLVVLNWDGKNITGMINPGTDNMAVKNATLNPDGWVVHLEADAKDKSGAALTYVIDGKIEDLRLPNRSITGTWKNQRESGIFKVGRQ